MCSIHSDNLIFTDYDILGDIKGWEDKLQNLCFTMSQKYPLISQYLSDCMHKFDEEPNVSFHLKRKVLVGVFLSAILLKIRSM